MEIYVVMSQPNLMSAMSTGAPLGAFQDYPSALAYAKTVFNQLLSFNGQTAKDLIFLITITPTSTISPTSPAAAVPAATAHVPIPTTVTFK
jgi:hypothetical protein